MNAFLRLGAFAAFAWMFSAVCVVAQDSPSDAPVARSLSIAEFIKEAPSLPKNGRIQLRGAITAFWGPTAFFIQEGDAAVFVFLKTEAGSAHVGDAVTITGLPSLGGRTPHLEVRELTVLGPATPPTPATVTIHEATAGALDARVVRLRGRVADGRSPFGDANSVLLESDGVQFTAEFVGAEDGTTWQVYKRGELVEVSGVCSVRGEHDKSPVPIRILLHSRRDAVVVGGQPWWMPPRVYYWIAFSFLVCSLPIVWAFFLRRQVRRKTTEIRERFEAESAIERRYRQLWESATDVILTHDLEGRVTSFNPAGERLLGWRADEILGRNIAELLSPDEREIAGTLARTNEDKTASAPIFHLHLQSRDDRSLPFEINSWLEYQDGEPVGVQAICRDISERQRTEEERVRIERKMQEAQKLESLGVLAGGVAHDFNNLLTAILGNANLAALDVPEGTPARESLDQIERAAERAADLCRQMLAYSGKGRFVLESVSMAALVRDTAELLRASMSKKIGVDLWLDPSLPGVMGDPTQLRQIVMNLLLNAGEAIGDKEGKIIVTTGLETPAREWFQDAQVAPESPDGEYVFLEVRDTGPGMSPETQARIFDPFFTTKFTGRGLGLAAVLGIVRGHRGALKVASKLGTGTVFRLLLPAAGAMPTPVSTRVSPAETQMRHGLILVVDDEQTVRTTVHRLVESLGCEAVTAIDGIDAVEKFRKLASRTAAVVLDLTMPRMDGAEALRELRRIRPDVRVLLMSGFAESHAMARFAGEGVDAFLQKPFTSDELRTKLRAVLGAPRSSDSSPLVHRDPTSARPKAS